jgi:hypothetical protein
MQVLPLGLNRSPLYGFHGMNLGRGFCAEPGRQAERQRADHEQNQHPRPTVPVDPAAFQG